MKVRKTSEYPYRFIHNESDSAYLSSGMKLANNGWLRKDPITDYEIHEQIKTNQEVKIFKFEQNENILTLLIGKFWVEVEGENISFNEQFKGNICYDLKTKRMTFIDEGENIDLKENQDKLNEILNVVKGKMQEFDAKSMSEIKKFTNQMILSECWSEFFYGLLYDFKLKQQSGWNPPKGDFNYLVIFRLFSLDLVDLIEKLIKVDMSNTALEIVRGKVKIENFVKSNKLKDILNVPKYALDFAKHMETLNKKSYSEYVRRIIKRCGDGAKSIFDFIEAVIKIYKIRDDGYQIEELLKLVNSITMKIKDAEKAFNYIVKVLINHGELDGKVGSLFDLLRYYNDYLDMNKKMKIKFDLYPDNLKKAHDISAAQYRFTMEERQNEKFAEATSTYSDLAFENDNYVVLVPDKTTDLIEEGHALHHCVGSYVDRVARKETKILFVRKKDKLKESYMTLEVRGHKLIQAKKLNNAYPVGEDEKFLKVWAEEKKIAVGGY